MRGYTASIGTMFFAIDLNDRIRADHPLRPIRETVNQILRELSPLFDQAYSKMGRPSVPPEVLLLAMVLQSLYSIRSEAQLVERLDTDLLFRWFCGLDPAQDVFDATAFTHNRPRLDQFGITAAFFDAVRRRAIDAGLASDEHFSVDGSLIESYASIKSFKAINDDDENDDNTNTDDGESTTDAHAMHAPQHHNDSNGFKSRNAEVDFRGRKRSNQTHRSTTDPEARLYRKAAGQEAKLAHLAHVISENRNGLIMAVAVTEANGRAEREAAIEMLDHLHEHSISPKTIGADRGYDSGAFLLELEARQVTPHTAMLNTSRNSGNIPKAQRAGYEARQRMRERQQTEAYTISQRCRKKTEEAFGWLKTVGGLTRWRHVGRWKLKQHLEIGAATLNLVRMRNLLAT